MDDSSAPDLDRPWSPVHADGGDQEVDRLLDAVGTYRRRCVLYCLMETDTAELEELTRSVSAMENDQAPDDIPTETLDDVKADLYHQTLPKLAELKIIEYDPRSETIRYQHPPLHFEEFLSLTRDLDPV